MAERPAAERKRMRRGGRVGKAAPPYGCAERWLAARAAFRKARAGSSDCKPAPSAERKALTRRFYCGGQRLPARLGPPPTEERRRERRAKRPELDTRRVRAGSWKPELDIRRVRAGREHDIRSASFRGGFEFRTRHSESEGGREHRHSECELPRWVANPNSMLGERGSGGGPRAGFGA